MAFKKVPALSAESNYAQFGSWKTDLGAYLSRNDMQLWSTLDEAKMPDGYPAEVEEEETDTVEYEAYVKETKRYKSRYAIDDE